MQRCFLLANSREIDDGTPIKLRVLSYQACIDAGDTCVFPIRKEASPNSDEGITLHTMFEIQLHEDASPNSDSGLHQNGRFLDNTRSWERNELSTSG
jgi:hypothetical protein